MTTSANLQSNIPALGVLQFDTGSLGSGINLFRGNLAFPLKLLTLPSRGGLAFDLTLMYQSNVSEQVQQWNLTQPSGSYGVGWALPLERVVADSKATGNPLDADYYLMSQGQMMRLVAIPAEWSRGTLPAEMVKGLSHGPVPYGMADALELQGWRPSDAARLEPTGRPGELLLHDPQHQRSHRILVTADGSATVTAAGESFETSPYQFWQVTFYPQWNSWEIVRPDGSVSIYGGAGRSLSGIADRNLVQWGIRWGNWVGPSLEASGQERYPVAWNLAEMRNTVGNWLAFAYRTTEQTVGSGTLTYTKECQIAEMQNDLGWSCRFHWAPMTYDNSALDAPKEYLVPNSDPTAVPSTQPNAWQSRYDTVYLDYVDVFNDANAPQVRLNFEWYDLTNLAPVDANNPLGTGACYKRYLKGVTDVYPDGSSRPGIYFTYSFANASSPNLGALTAMTLPTGGVVRYEYAEIDVGADQESDPGARNLTIDNPFGKNQAGAPRIWYGADYVLVAWYDFSINALLVNIYTWVGRWVPAWSDWQRFDGALDIDRVAAVNSENGLLLILTQLDDAASKVYLCSRRAIAVADWAFAGGSAAPTAYPYQTGQLRVATGADFFLVIDNDNDRIDRYALNWQTRGWDIATLGDQGVLCQGSGGTNISYYATAFDDHYLLFCYDSDSATGKFSLFYRDRLLAWHAGGTLATTDITIPTYGTVSYFQLAPGSSFAAAAWINQFSASGGVIRAFDYRVAVLTWDDDYGNLQFAPLPDVFASEGFTNLSSAFMQTLGPAVIGNTVVGTGPNVFRFDGENWTYHFTGINYQPGTDISTQFYWYAWDIQGVLKTENTTSAVYSALDSIDSNDPAQQWTTQVLQDSNPPPPDRTRIGFPTVAGTLLSQNGGLYSRSVWPSWSHLSSYYLGAITLANFDSTTVINQAPDFLAYMTLDGDGEPRDTQVVFFRNGDLLRDSNGQPVYESFSGQQMFQMLNDTHRYQTAVSGKLPAIPSGFVTFPSGKDIDESTQITLHRYANHSLQAPLTAFVVTALTQDSGYQVLAKSYAYADISAASDGSGSVVQFASVSEYQATLDPAAQQYGWTTSRFYNGLPPRVGSDGADALADSSLATADAGNGPEGAYTMLAGMLWAKEVYSTDGSLVSSQVSVWNYVDQVAVNATGTALRNIYSAVPQIGSSVDMLQGVARTMDYTYSAASGAPSVAQTSYYDSTGALSVTRRSSQFGFEHYPALWSANILTPVALATTQVLADGSWALQAAKVQTFRAWSRKDGSTYWAEADSWVATDADATPFAWWNGGTPSAGWLLEESITDRGDYGQVLLSYDVTNRPMASLFDDKGRFRIASFTNSAGGHSYDSFESYQAPTWSLPSGAVVFGGDAATGVACLAVTASGTLRKSVTVADAATPQLFMLSFKSPAGAVAGDFTVRLAITAPNGSSIGFTVPATDGAWEPVQWTIDMSPLELQGSATLTLSITVDLATPAAPWVRLDDVVFVPLQSQFQGVIFDAGKLRTCGTAAPNGNQSRTVYNPYEEPSATIGPWNNPTLITVTYFAAQSVVIGPEHAFPVDAPNAAINVKGNGAGFYDPFADGALSQYEAVSGNLGDWTVNQYQLSYHGSATGPLGARLARSGFAASSIAARVLVDPAAIGTVVLGTGTWFVTRGGGVWQLWQLSGASPTLIASSSNGTDADEWLLIAGNGRLLFFADGLKVFEYADEAVVAPFGVQLGMTAPGTFRDLVVAQDIGFSIEYRDGLARAVQSLSLEGSDSAILDLGLYDECGNVAIKALSSRVTVSGSTPLFAYQTGLVTNGGNNGSLWDGAPLEGTLSSLYHPEAQGYPFSRTAFEATPLARPVAFGLPGMDFAIRPGNSHFATRSYSVNQSAGQFLYPLPVGQYHIVTDTDANGAITERWSDTAENLIGRVVQNSAEDITLNWRMSQVYDTVGRPVATIPPSAYVAGAAGTGTLPAGSSTASFDFAGHRLSTTDPDSGTSEVVYSSSGLLRFLANGNALTDGYIVYRKYDSLSRVIEEGTYPQVWNRDTLQSHADDPAWPPTPPTWSIQRIYDGDGSAASQADNLPGRLWQIRVNQGAQGATGVLENYAYDRAGRITQRTRTVAGFDLGEGCTVANQWSDGGNLLASSDTATSVTSYLSYDPLGRVVAVDADTGGTRTRLAVHTYDPDGKPASTTLLPDSAQPLLRRAFAYAPPRWPAVLDAGSLLTENLSYTEGACDGGGYYDGLISRQAIASDVAGVEAGANCASFDALGRLTAFGAGATGQTWQMDVDGNFQQQTRGDQSATFSYTPDSNRLDTYTSSGSASTRYAYDDAGAVVSASSDGLELWKLGYDAATSRPVSFAQPSSGTLLSVLRDGDGNRTLATRTQNGSTLSQLFQMPAPGGEVVIEAVSHSRRPVRFISAIDVQIAWCDGEFYFGLLDHLGSVRVVIDSGQNVVGAWRYDVYGATTMVVAPAIPWPRLYTGHNYDPDSGFYDCNARFYHPVLGRYLSVDPYLQTPSPYVYCGNNPLLYTDPNGMNVWGIIVGAAVTLAIGVAGVFLLGTGVGAAILVGLVAGAVGAMAGDLMSMATGDQISWKQFAIDAVAGAASGAAGALAGGAAGALTARAALGLGAGKVATSISVTLVSGISGGVAGATAGSGVTAFATGQPFFSRATALNIAIGAVVGTGAGLMAAGAHLTFFTGRGSRGVNPTELTDHTKIPSFPDPHNNPLFPREAGQGGLQGKVRILMPSDPVTDSMRLRWESLSPEGQTQFETRLTTVNGQPVDVVATHGIARSAMVEWTSSNTGVTINRPISAQTLAAFLRQEGYGSQPIKLVTCFAAMPGRFSLAQALANEMGVSVYAHWWTVNPNPNVATNWIRFNPS